MRVAAGLLVSALLLAGCMKPRCEATDRLRAEVDGVRYAVPVSLQPSQSASLKDRMARTEWGYEAKRGRYLYCQGPGAPTAKLDGLLFDARRAPALPSGILRLSLHRRLPPGARGYPATAGAPELFGQPVNIRCPVYGETICRLVGKTPEGLILQFDVDTAVTRREAWPALFTRLEAFERGMRPAA